MKSFNIYLLIIINFLTYKNVTAKIDFSEGKCKITGVVIDSINRSKIEYASVAIFKSIDSSIVGGKITDDKGRFEIIQIPEGKYYMLIYFMGFSTKLIDNIIINSDSKVIDMGEIVLSPEIKHLKEVNITSEKREIVYKLDKKIINANSLLSSTGGTAIDILKNSQSVIVDNEDNVTIRGNSGFQVFINGKPSALKGSDALKQIPASTIDNIEIITNPSANYDAEGTAGIINVITKKNSVKRLGAMINLTGCSDRANADINLSQHNEKINYTFGVKYNYYNVPIDVTNDRIQQIKDSLFFIKNSVMQYHKTKIGGINFGIDYEANKSNTFSFTIDVGTWRHFHDFSSKSNTYSSKNPINNYYSGKNDFEIGYEYCSANLFYKHNFKKNHELSTNIFYSFIYGDRRLESFYGLSDYYYSILKTEIKNRSKENNNSEDIRYKLDYKRPFVSDIIFESGIQMQFKPYDADMKFDNFNFSNKLWCPDTNYTHDILFNVNNYATYLSLSKTTNNFDCKMGLRTEYYERVFAYKNTALVYTYKHLDFFPTLHFSYKKSNVNQYQISMSRRVNRPSAWFMYPIPDYTDGYSISVGNPDLIPEFINSFEFNYIHNFKKALISIEIFHKRAINSFYQRHSSIQLV